MLFWMLLADELDKAVWIDKEMGKAAKQLGLIKKWIKQLWWIKRINNIDHEISQKMLPFYFNRPVSIIMNIVSMSCSWAFCFPLYFLFLLLTRYNIQGGLLFNTFNGFGQNSSLIFYHIITAEFIQLTIIIPVRYCLRRPRPVSHLPFIFLEKWKLYPLWKLYSFLEGWNQYSFPSLHASRAFMLCMIVYNGLAIYRVNSIIYFLILISGAVTIAFSRLVLQRHFLSDVITGAMVGIISSFITLNIVFSNVF